MATDPTQRFSSRVSNYVKFRPGYPAAVIEYLQQQAGLGPQSVVVDVGAGTGIFTRLLLDAGYTVFAVEPNVPMRQEAETQLVQYPRFTPVNGTAEVTTLPANLADLVVCAQAFHWFNNDQTKAEFKRILKPGSKAALIWNNRKVKADDFARAYDELLRNQSGDYERVNHQNLSPADFEKFYHNGQYQLAKFPNQQVFNLEQLIGRAFSSSYMPEQDSAEGLAIATQLKEIFDRYQSDGSVVFRYDTEVYLGVV